MGSALRSHVNFAGGKLGLPEVVESEVSKHLVKEGTGAVDNIEAGFDTLLTLLGAHRPYEVPSSEQIRDAISNGIAEMESILVRVPLTLEHTRAALARVNAELPPNTKGKQQFKDSLIWEALLELGQSYTVHFVTGDGHFREAGGNGELARVLREECLTCGVELHLHAKIADCLEAIRTEAPNLDYAALRHRVLLALAPVAVDYADEYGLRIDRVERNSTKAFATERHNLIAVDFEVIFSASEAQLDEGFHRSGIRLTIAGSCSFTDLAEEPDDMKISEVTYEWLESTGIQQRFGSVFLSGSGHSGREPDVRYTVKREIMQQPD